MGVDSRLALELELEVLVIHDPPSDFRLSLGLRARPVFVHIVTS